MYSNELSCRFKSLARSYCAFEVRGHYSSCMVLVVGYAALTSPAGCVRLYARLLQDHTQSVMTSSADIVHYGNARKKDEI